MTDIEEKLLKTIIDCEISLYTCSYAPPKAVVSTGNLAKLLNCSKYKARKGLKELLAAGYIEYTSQGQPAIESNTENGYELISEAGPPINGYALTESGFQTKQFKEALKRFDEAMEKWANSCMEENRIL